MTCQHLIEFLLEYLSGELPAAERAAFEQHLGKCPPCVTYLTTYEQTIRLSKAVLTEPSGPVPEDVPPGLVEAILAARARGAPCADRPET